MRCPVAILALTSVLLAAARLPAEGPPYLEFVRALRERGYPDLALEYLQKLSQSPPADIGSLLPLEMAKTRLDIAAAETDVAKRLALYVQARGEFETFVKGNATHPLVPEAQLAIAQVAVLQGKTQLSQALKQEGPARIAEANKARTVLEDAGKQLQAAAALLKQQLESKYKDDPKNPQEAAEKKALEQARFQAQYDIALNFLDQAQTYVDTSKVEAGQQRAKIVEKAVPLLDDVVAKAGEHNPLSWQARAWLARTEHENGKSNDAMKKLRAIQDEKAVEANAGKRLAHYFLMIVVPDATDFKGDKNREIIQLGESWLRGYPGSLNTPEGCGVRYTLAEAYLKEAVNNKQVLQQRQQFARALDFYRALERTENEYTDRARQKKVMIIFNLQGADKLRGEVRNLPTFDDCYVRAQYEFGQIAEEAKKEDPKLEEKREAHHKTIIVALTRAVELAKKDPKVLPQDLAEAKYSLAYTHYLMGQYAEARRVAEELARVRPPTSLSPKAAISAIQAYTHLEEERDGLRKLAEYTEQTWPDQAAGHTARHQLGLLLMREKKFPEAVEKLSLIKADYPLYTISQYYLGLAALQAHEDNAQPPPGKPAYLERAVAALQAIPDLSADADRGQTQIYVIARLKLGQLLYQQKKYDQIEALAKALLDRWQTLNLPGRDEADAEAKKAYEELRGGAVTLSLFAVYGKADAEYRAGHFAKVREVTDPIVDQLRDNKLPEVKKNPQLMFGLLSLALRANVQEGKAARAQDILKILQEAAKSGEAADNSTQIFLSLAQSLREQVKELSKKEGPEAKEQLEKTKASFAGFLDELAKQEKMSTETIIFLSHCYSSLGMHDKSAELLRKIQAPRPGNDKEPADPKDQQGYRGSRMLLVRELRLGKKFAEAKALLDEIGNSWGKGSLEVTKEKNSLLEDEGQYLVAARAWNDMMTALRPKSGTDPRAKELYWEAYYHLTWCVYKHGLAQSDPQKRAKYVKDAANFILKLEKSQKDWGGEASKQRFGELLGAEKLLKDEVEELKKNAN